MPHQVSLPHAASVSFSAGTRSARMSLRRHWISNLKIQFFGAMGPQKSQSCFKSARFRSLNSAELIYSEVGFCFHTASAKKRNFIA